MGRAESLSAIFFLTSIAAYQRAILQGKGLGEYIYNVIELPVKILWLGRIKMGDVECYCRSVCSA